MYTDGQVIFRTNVEGSGEEKSFPELQTQGLEKMFHIIHRPENTQRFKAKDRGKDLLVNFVS